MTCHSVPSGMQCRRDAPTPAALASVTSFSGRLGSYLTSTRSPASGRFTFTTAAEHSAVHFHCEPQIVQRGQRCGQPG